MATILARTSQLLSRKLLLNVEQAVSESGVNGLRGRSIHTTSRTPCSKAPPSGRRLNVGIMGAGRIAANVHLRNIVSNHRLNLQWITEDDADRVPVVKDLFGLHNMTFLTSRDLPDLLSKKDLDAVFIFTPTSTHCKLACESLSKGKAVFVEKPAGENIDEIRSCYEHSEKFGRPFLTGYNKRFDTSYARVVRAVHNNEVGDIQVMSLTSRDSPKPSYDFLASIDSTGCGILTDVTVHDIDMMVWITKAERPESIYVMTHAHDKKMAEFGEADTIVVVVKYKGGVMVTLDTSRYAAYGYDMRMEVFGSDGLASVENPKVSSDVISGLGGAKLTRLHESFPQRFRESYMNEIDHFIDCVYGKAKPLITKEQSVMTAEIIAKGLESHRLKKPVYF